MNKLTAKQERFCKEYLIDLNATQAAIRSGYSKKTAEVQGSRLLSKAKIKNEIDKLKSEREARIEINADWVIKKWEELIEICMVAKPVMIKVGKKLIESGEYRIDSFGANKALENLAKHLNMFQEPVPMNVIQNFVSGNGNQYEGKTDKEIEKDLKGKYDLCTRGNRSSNRLSIPRP